MRSILPIAYDIVCHFFLDRLQFVGTIRILRTFGLKLSFWKVPMVDRSHQLDWSGNSNASSAISLREPMLSLMCG
jgi:hypothetical protein